MTVAVVVIIWLAILSGIASLQFAALALEGKTRIAVIDTVFAPWLKSIHPGSADFEARYADYVAAWDRWKAIPNPETPAPACWIEQAFEYAERRSSGKQRGAK